MGITGIIGAMDEEVALLKKEMNVTQVHHCAGMDFYEGDFEGRKAVVVRCGIGKVNAAMCTQILADRFKVDRVINTGVAGSLKSVINIGDIVLSVDALQHDMDATGFGYEPGVIPRMETSIFKADDQLVELAEHVCRQENPEIQVFKGRIVSGDQFVSDQDTKTRILRQFDGYCTEMEGAAIAHAAWKNRIPFVVIRAISDKADDSAQMDYPTFEAIAAVRCANVTMRFAELLKQKG